MSVPRHFTLRNGIRMPSVGLGTYRVRDPATIHACLLAALKAGYRLIDTAAVYRNEEAIGVSLKTILANGDIPGLKREDVFLTSKLAPKDQGYHACRAAVLDSMRKLQVDRLDLMLIHWPGTSKLKLPDPQNAINRAGSWRALEEFYHEGKLSAIGVSNYTVRHLTQMLPFEKQQQNSESTVMPSSDSKQAAVMPMVLQFEMHPRLIQRQLLDFCKSYQIQVQAYSSLGEGELIKYDGVSKDVTSDSTTESRLQLLLESLVEKYFPASSSSSQPTATESGNCGPDEENMRSATRFQKRAAQILLCWGLQNEAVVIPKSAQPQRIRDNFDLFSLHIDAEDMLSLNQYSEGSDQRRFCWDPTNVN